MRPAEYISQFPRELIASSEGRRLLTRDDPLLFALVYLGHHLRRADELMSLAQFHLDLCEYAKQWMNPDDASRDCFIAPRNSGKTTWIFLLLPAWAAAHGHLKFIAAFSDSAAQATQHLQTFKGELDSNLLIRKDYPELCQPLMGGNVKRYVAQSQEMIQQSNGFSFSAKGVDSKSLGLKIGNTRPDLLLLDDVEPGESNYSLHEAEKRKRTIIDSLLYLNDRAHVSIVGTTTMSNSLIDQIRKVGEYRREFELEKSLYLNADSTTANDDEERKRLSVHSPIILSYVNLDPKSSVNQTFENARNGTSDHLEAIEQAFGQSVTQKGIKSLESGTVDHFSASEGIARNESNRDLSNEKVSGIDRQDGFISEPVKNLVDNDSEDCLTLVEKSDLNSVSVSDDTSTSISSMSQPEALTQPSFLQKQRAELEKFNIKSEPNRGEADLATAQIEYNNFSDFLDPDLHWVEDERIQVHYYPAIVVDAEGSESSWWPEYKSLDELNRIRHTRAFAMNMQNRPVSIDAQFWNEQDIVIAEAESYVRTLISVDPAVSTKTSNDYTALVVVSLASDGKVYIRHAEQIRLVSTALKERVDELIELFAVGLVYVETNQGGNLWKSVFDGVKANFRSVHQTEPKSLRAARALDYYRKDKVRHTRHFDQLEEQMYSFPKVAHDDLIDAMGTGVHYFLSASSQPKAVRKTYI